VDDTSASYSGVMRSSLDAHMITNSVLVFSKIDPDVRSEPLPSTSFPIYYALIILTLGAI
jgi:hypothetical protein